MAVAKITEYRHGSRQALSVVSAGQEPSLAVQNISFTTAQPSAAFNAKTHLVRVKADAKVYIRVGKPGETVAIATDTDLEANVAEYFGVTPGYVISVYDGVS